MNAVLRLPQLQERVGLSKATLYNMMSEGEFPRPIKLGPRAVGWLSSDIEKWIELRARTGVGRSRTR